MYDLGTKCDSVGLGMIVLGIEGIPNLFVVVILLVIVQAISANKSCRDETYVCLTFNDPNNKNLYCI